MKITILNGSPSGDESITLYTWHYISRHFPEHECTILNVAQKIRSMETNKELWQDALREAELIVFCYPVYTFLVPAQLHRFIELMKESGIDFAGKWATQISTSKHFYDVTAHAFIEENCHDLSMKVLKGLSADMDDLLQPRGRGEALAFFRSILWQMKEGLCEWPAPKPLVLPDLLQATKNAETFADEGSGSCRVAIVADLGHDEEGKLEGMCSRLMSRLSGKADLIRLDEFAFAGGCIGCFHCAADGQCIYKDGFDDFLRNRIQSADAIVFAFSIHDHSMGQRFKLFDDRQFCNGHRTVTMGKPMGFLVDGYLSQEPNLQMLLDARAQVGGNAMAGVAGNEADPNGQIDALARRLLYLTKEGTVPPRNFYGVGGLKIFRDLIWQMQGLMRADHKFYKAHGFYDFPQKKRGTMMAMYLVGLMMNNKSLRKKMGGKMTEGMIQPYKKALELEADSKQNKS